MGRPSKILTATPEQREQLEALARATTTPQAIACRVRIVLLTLDGLSVEAVTEKTGAVRRTVYEWRRRFEAGGVAALQDLPRSGRPSSLTPEKTDAILKLTIERIPHEATHWSQRLMAKYAGVSANHVARVWKLADLKPHRLKTFKISRDPQFAEKVRDVVGLYMNPPENALVLSVDEKTQIQALDRTQPMLQLRPGQIQRRTHDYKRHGTRSLYAAFDIATGKVIGRVTKRHRGQEFLDFLRQIDQVSSPEFDLHVILDNSSTHKTPRVQEWLAEHPRFHMHFTPTSASWLNAVESWFGQLERRSLYRGAFTSTGDLRDELKRYIESHNERSAKPFRWTRTADAILRAVEKAKALPESRMVASTYEAGH